MFKVEIFIFMVKSCKVSIFHGKIAIFHGEIAIFRRELPIFAKCLLGAPLPPRFGWKNGRSRGSGRPVAVELMSLGNI
jgi:hypothetical protein